MLLLCVAALAASLQCGDAGGNASLTYFNEGKKHYARKNLNKADELFRKAAEEDPGLLNATLMRAKIRYYRRDFPGSLSFLDDIINENGNHLDALFWKARVLVVGGEKTGIDRNEREREAVKCLTTVIEADSGHVQARTLLALLYEKNRKYRESLYQYHAALREEESLVHARSNLAILYARMGLKDRALKELKTAMAICDAAAIPKSNLLEIKKEIETP
jgi:tetratricopeptide (TPR) repeat protein